MNIKEQLSNKKPLISFEIFPPKSNYTIDTIYNTIDELNSLHPDFISVTYGAGGSEKDRTVEISSYIQNKYELSSLAHVTCISSSKAEIKGILNELEDKGIHNVLALRGDRPKDAKDDISLGDFNNSVELIEFFKKNSKLCIGAACYPEKHPEAKDILSDIEFLKRKEAAGADFFVTQMFFDNELFYDFYDKTVQKGIKTPIFTGIMPISNPRQVKTIIRLTGNAIPKKLNRLLDRYENDEEALKEAGLSYAISQIIDLLSWGVDGVHIYTMNKPEIAKTIIESIKAIREVLTKV